MLDATIDVQLIERCKQGENTAQKKLYEICYPSFAKTCLRYTNDYDEMAFVLNDAFLKIFKQIAGFENKGAFEGWMHRIVVNTAIDFARKAKRERVESTNSEDIGYEQEMVQDESGVLQVIRTLESPEREIFNLFAIEGYPHQEIADLLKITVATSKWHLFNARKTLKEKIKELL